MPSFPQPNGQLGITHPPTHPNASLFLFVAIFQLEHETYGKESVLQWCISAKVMFLWNAWICDPSSFQNVELWIFGSYLVGERKQGLQGPGNKGRRGHRLGSVHTSAATSYTTNCCDMFNMPTLRHCLSGPNLWPARRSIPKTKIFLYLNLFF